MESALSAFKRPVNGFGANNALPLREMHQERKEKRKRPYGGRGHWTESHDLKLIEPVAAYGPQRWHLIGEKMQTRRGKSCIIRWSNQLISMINRTDSSEDEEKRMLTAHRFYGIKWSKIAKPLNERTENDVKNHWTRIVRRQTNPNIRFFNANLNGYASNPVPGYVSHEGTEIKSYNCNMRNEETTYLNAQDLQEENNSFRMPVLHSGHHHHFSTFPAGSLALFIPHVNISQPPPSSSSSSPEAADTMTRKTPKYIDFLGVGDS